MLRDVESLFLLHFPLLLLMRSLRFSSGSIPFLSLVRCCECAHSAQFESLQFHNSLVFVQQTQQTGIPQVVSVPTKAPTSSLKLFRLRNPFQGLSSIIKPLHLARTQKIAFVSNSRVAAVAALSYFCTRLYIRIIELWNHAWMNSLWCVSSQDRPRGSHSFLMLSISAMALRLETAKGQGDLFGLRTATKEKNTYNIMCIICISICIYIYVASFEQGWQPFFMHCAIKSDPIFCKYRN